MTKAADHRLSEAAKTAKQKANEARDKKQLRLIRCMNVVFASEEGLVVLRHLVEICGYEKSDIVGNAQTGEVLDKSTFYNMVRRGLYVELRKFLRSDILKKAEYPEDEAAKSIEEILN